jgi:pimeloyl-ACP methyl ester carboxylesterase
MSAARSSGVALRHGRINLALHELRPGPGRPLLLLHGLGERSPDDVPSGAAAWPGPVHGLDFTGHGRSDVPAGGGYTSEHLLSDADVALAALGPATVLGRGLGGYVALLLAGSRPTEVRGAVIADGPGLAGGGSRPGSASVITVEGATTTPPDPFALAELARDVRPPDYAASFARQATHLSGLDWPISVAARLRPDWLAAVAHELGVQDATVQDALATYAELD